MTDQAGERRWKKSERREQILLELRLVPHVRVADLAQRFSVTTETIRRDIDELERAGLLKRSFGGASAQAPGRYRGLDERSRERIDERRRLAAHAAQGVTDGTSLMIDAGSTTVEFARALATLSRRVTVVTNSLQVATILGSIPRSRVILAPGDYRHDEAATVGTETCQFLARYNVDACYLGASGLGRTGITEVVEGFAAVKQAMMQRAARVNFLADASKFGRTHLSSVAEPAQIGTLYSDMHPPPELLSSFLRAGVMIRTPV